MLEPPKVVEPSELIIELDFIGSLKNDLPFRLRGWLNVAGLYVQLRTVRDMVRLEAGGKFRNYFDAVSNIPYFDVSDWKIRRYDKEAWEHRFAHLVFPTHEIVLFVGGSPFKPPGSHFDENAVFTLQQVVKHFEATGEWLGLLHKKCVSCSHEVTMWELQKECCPYCGGNMGRLWEE